MEYQSSYPNRKTRRSYMNMGKVSKARGNETVWEFGMRISDNVKAGNKLHNDHTDRSLKSQEEFLMKREESYRALLKGYGLNTKAIDEAVIKWYDLVIKTK